MLAGMISDRQSPTWSSIRDYPDDPVSRSNSREFAALANGPLPGLWIGLMGLQVEIELQHIHPGSPKMPRVRPAICRANTAEICSSGRRAPLPHGGICNAAYS